MPDPVMVVTAFLAGLSTVLTPCGYSLLPALVLYGGSGTPTAREALRRFLMMAMGSIGTLAILTLAASTAKFALAPVMPHMTLVAGAGTVALALAGRSGLGLAGPLLIGSRSSFRMVAAGALYAFGAAGCALPTFLVLVLYSALLGPEGSVPLLAAYSAGMLLPVGALVLALSLIGGRAIRKFSGATRYTWYLGRFVLLAAGLYMVYVWSSLGALSASG
ncbi:MAG: hypothetical protein NYU90_05355 [Aigarchaeota archaeon]|nr:hypothetical protein [Candidatus Calditenuis fumarioli]